VHIPRLPFELDPLIAEAKRRAWRRRTLLSVIAVVAVASAAGGWFVLRSSGGAVGLCTTPPVGWKERTIPRTSVRAATVVMTNFGFGRMDDLYGLTDTMRWPADGAMIAVVNEGPAATPLIRRALRVGSRDFVGFEGMRWPAAHVAIRSRRRVLEAYVEIRTVTPATLAAANRALAGVRACST
jgi:hypothetical protein